MMLTVLGDSYKYASAPYERSSSGYLNPGTAMTPSMLGGDFDWGGFWNGLVSVADKGMSYVTEYTKAKQAGATSADSARLDNVLTALISGLSQGKSIGQIKAETEGVWYKQPIPWIIIGGVGLLAVVVLMSMSRRRR